MDAVYEVVEISRVRPNPNNIREDLGDLEQLAGELKSLGVQSPLSVCPHPDFEGDFMVTDGHRRLAAAVKAGLSVIPVFIKERSARGAVADVEAMMTTGRNHRSLTRAEEAKGFQLLLDLGQSESTIGKKFKRPKSEVLALGRVSKAPEKLQSAYTSGRLDLLAVKRLTDLEAAGQSGVLDKVLDGRDFSPNFGWRIDDVERKIARAEQDQIIDDMKARLLGLGGVMRKDLRDENFDTAPEMTDEEHIAAGHQFSVTADQVEARWYVKLAKPKRTLSDQEREEKATLRNLGAGLQVSFAVRGKEIVAAILSKEGVSEAKDKELLLELILPDIMRLKDETLTELTGIQAPEDAQAWDELRAWRDKVEASLSKLSWRQLARAAAYAKNEDKDRQLRFTKNFDRNAYEWPARRGWLNKVQTHFGVRLYQPERETLAFFKAKGGDRKHYDPRTDTYVMDAEDVTILDDEVTE